MDMEKQGAVKFSPKSEHYEIGDTITINCEDGTKVVYEVVKKD